MRKKCRVMLYFHMHQPYYKELRSDSYKMPWARLHSLKNYADIPDLHRKFPDLKISYNIVPSLIEQIEDYAAGATDDFLEVSKKPANQLSQDEKRFILANFFQLNRKTQIEPIPRFLELLALKGSQKRHVPDTALHHYTDQDYRDLQVHFNLAWSGWLLRSDKRIRGLIEKERRYSEKDKEILFSIQEEFLKNVFEPYNELLERGSAELTTSPYYHPILPLLCDTLAAREALPSINLPGEHFSWPEDADQQITAAVQKHNEVFQREPAGMWPSEGSISNHVCKLMIKNNISWAASDSTVLANSLGVSRDKLSLTERFSPWQLKTESGDLTLVFRDTEFSDLIGFTYQHWNEEKAIEDFIGRLKKITEAFPSGKTPLIPVILDGENAWAYYENNGHNFLEHLYQELSSKDWIETILPSEMISSADYKPLSLKNVVAGSWIYGNLSTWIGHHEKNRGWEILAKARSAFEQSRANGAVVENELQKAQKELFIAEGSDWFWWYGDDHSTAYASEFDSLFREHVTNIYRFLELEIPHELYDPIKDSSVDSGIEPPMRLISPTLDGYVTRYTEWINSGLYTPRGGAEMMHQASDTIIKSIRFGFDKEKIYIRFDASRPLTEKPLTGYNLLVQITAPDRATITFDFDDKRPPVLKCRGKTCELEYGCGAHFEFALSWEDCESDTFAFYAVLQKGEEEMEIHPRSNVISMNRSDENYNALMWRV
jgi:alpha-amylase/alpha-mannosidase (GH57 family)